MRFGRELGRGTWGKKTARLYRAERPRDRGRRNLQRRAAVRNYTTAMAVGALILGAVLLMPGATRGAGLAVLVLAGLVLYVILGRKRAGCGFGWTKLPTWIGVGRLGGDNRLGSAAQLMDAARMTIRNTLQLLQRKA